MATMLKTPVALIIFNRPDTTAKVFEAIRQAKPPLLLVIADGARTAKEGEAEKCAVTRAIIDGVDWDCEVRTNYSDVNLGCKRRVSSGIDWVFEQVEEAIILEDDCLPHPSFFDYCDELLDKYRYDTRIMSISGDNFQFGRQRTSDSYYFSQYNHIWGWATWRRAWKHYDVNVQLWNTVRDGGWLDDILNDASVVEVWQKNFQDVHDGKVDTWDYQWVFACWVQSGLTILPNVNLISNIGFGVEATHTRSADNKSANLPVEAISLPLQHPEFVVRNLDADKYFEHSSKHFERSDSPLMNIKKTISRYIKT
jgi:hypothetical protein